MIRPRKMKQIEFTVLSRHVNEVIEYLGRRGIMQFSDDTIGTDTNSVLNQSGTYKGIVQYLELLKDHASYLHVDLPAQPEEDSRLPNDDTEKILLSITDDITELRNREIFEKQEEKKIEETLSEAKSFSNLNAPFAELDQLSYLTLRVGRLDPNRQAELKKNLADRAVIIPLGDDGRILAAASRKGRFALDSELKKQSFVPITIPEGYQGVPAELISGLEEKLSTVKTDLVSIDDDKLSFKNKYGPELKKLTVSYLMASKVESLKDQLQSTQSTYVLAGWVPFDVVDEMVADLEKITEGSIAIKSFDPHEVESIKDGTEKVPVSLKHGKFVKGFEKVVFSYGAPLYGTIDPTPFVAFFFAILFGIMFGDFGQGAVLLLLGFLTGNKKIKALANFRHFSTPLKAVGIASMVMGFLTGEVFTYEGLLAKPTEFITGLFGRPTHQILHLMPESGNIAKLFYFFGFTIGVGMILNSIGLIINIINNMSLKRYEKAIFSKTGIAGLIFFWYAIFIAVKIISGGTFINYDLIGLLAPVFFIFFGPIIWRIIAREKPVLEHGLMAFIMEGFVEILETISSYISNTVSFLRVGAFALSHAVLSFIVFTLSGMV
ncbi:MAG: V-type ATP synthase subunit I, partial [Treponema sp.]|nr:V-type ATP synthase subunit I [Treponema sp.]